jgi:hypothetical protein
MSTFDPSVHVNVPEAVDRVEEVTVEQRRLDSILREHAAGRTIHFLKIDVEGAEARVLASSDWTAFRPIVVIAEAIESWSRVPTHERWEHLLLDAGNRFAAFDGIDRFYVERDHEHLAPILGYPMSAMDRFVTAPAHESQVRLEQTLAELDQVGTELREQAGESDRLRGSLDDFSAELVQARDHLELVHGSRTWRAGRVLASAARPFQAVVERVRNVLR